jgi:hypothetical protein
MNYALAYKLQPVVKRPIQKGKHRVGLLLAVSSEFIVT